jgi:hypothetical protein
MEHHCRGCEEFLENRRYESRGEDDRDEKARASGLVKEMMGKTGIKLLKQIPITYSEV